MMGHAVYATYMIYLQMMKQYCPTVRFRFPFEPRLAVHPMSVLMAFRCDRCPLHRPLTAPTALTPA
jgi:hypothetical protein